MKTLSNLFKAAVGAALLPIDAVRDFTYALTGDNDGNVDKRREQIEEALDAALEPDTEE